MDLGAPKGRKWEGAVLKFLVLLINLEYFYKLSDGILYIKKSAFLAICLIFVGINTYMFHYQLKLFSVKIDIFNIWG